MDATDVCMHDCLCSKELARSLSLRVLSCLVEVILAPEPADEVQSYLWENTARCNAALGLVKMCSDPRSTRPTLPVRPRAMDCHICV